MEYVNLGTTGLKVSRLCMGTMTYGSKEWREWVLEEDAGRGFIKQALDLGINFFDTADMYSIGVSEQILGRALKDFAPSRDKVVVATKVFFPTGDDPNQRGLSRKHIMHAIDESLTRLRTDYVDLYQIHRFDYATPIEETMEVLTDLVKAGKVLYIGASSMYAWQFARMLYIADRHNFDRFVTMQNHYNLMYREEEREMVPLCRAEGIGLLPWSPLARGLLAGSRKAATLRSKVDDYAHQMYPVDGDNRVIDAVERLATQRGVPPAQVALAWLLHKPGVTAPIIGATKPHHLEDAVAAISVKLTEEEITALESVYAPHPVLGHH
ncbi:MAG TPA: aldo/keto reductase [Verrucomicrobiae bacterium]|jgi:aryl-alcohol dehydrogenase-like predicted oxidoreductase|nr:aldo/keto reductase [Verrucomicrobiae bacterium]